MECFGGGVNRMVCGMGLCGGWLGGGWIGVVVGWVRVGVMVVLSLGLGLGLGDCVWCVLLPKPVANATISSKTTPPVSHN